MMAEIPRYLQRRVDPGSSATFAYEIATIGVDGSRQRRLTENNFFDGYPSWSPDGARIAFVSSRGEPYEMGEYREDFARIFTMPADGSGGQYLVAAGRVGARLDPPMWSPDGQFLAFTGHFGPGRGATGPCPPTRILYTVRVDDRKLTEVGEAWSQPTWSPDSRRLAFARCHEGSASAYTVRRDGTDLREVWTTRPNKPHPPITQMAWSPDGSEILLVSRWLSMMSPVGGMPRVLGSFMPRARVDSIAWSPDGSRISARLAYPTGRRADEETLRVITMARDGTDARVLVSTNEDGEVRAHNHSRQQTPTDLTVCSGGLVVPEPEDNPGLVRDCKVLLGFRDQQAGSGKLDWGSDMAISKWKGIRVEGSPPRVQNLDLEYAGLTGTLPPELALLTEMRAVDFRCGAGEGFNALTGPVPPELGNLSKLRALLLQGNFLTGPIPLELGRLNNLRKLDLSYNFLSARIPAEVTRLGADIKGPEGCPRDGKVEP